MHHIRKTINLNQFRSYYPLTYPALRDSKPSFVTNVSIRKHSNANYKCIPYCISEEICGGSYSVFTEKMDNLYKGHVFDYNTISKWYKFFCEYNDLLFSNKCNIVYTSAAQYCTSVYGTNTSVLASYAQMDELYEERGGDNFYKWLSENYFLSVDLRKEYQNAVSDGLILTITYTEWLLIVDNLPSYVLYYPDAIKLLGKMQELKLKDCNNLDNCCDCNLFQSYGGESMIAILTYWIGKVESNILNINEVVKYNTNNLIPSAKIPLMLKKKVADFGNFVMFSTDYDPTKQYTSGNVCTYNDNVYILEGNGNGRKYNSITDEYEFNDSDWKTYYSYYKSSNPSEFSEFGENDILTGRTASSLEDFESDIVTVDNIGNVLPGTYTAYSGSTFVQPAEATWLGLKYQLGKTVNTTLINDNLFCGDVLESVEIYYLDSNGVKIKEASSLCTEGTDILKEIDRIAQSVISYDYVDILHADFTYYKNATFSYDNNSHNVVIKEIKVGKKNIKSGLKCIDSCTLQPSSISYYLSENEFYPINYYKVVKDVETQELDNSDDIIKTAMCTFYLYPCAFSENENNMIAFPVFRQEELLENTSQENIVHNIYIDRGYATVLDRHLRISEVTSLESLEKYGNGIFTMINSQEERI